MSKKKMPPKNNQPVQERPKSKLLKKPNFSKNQLTIFIATFALVGGYILWRSFAAGAIVATVQAESMNLPTGASVISDSSASNSQAVKMILNGNLTSTINLPSNAASATVSAKATQCSGSPTISVKLDSTPLLASTAVTSTSYTNFNVSGNFTSGTHTLSLTGANIGNLVVGKSKVKCARSLTIDLTTFYAPNITPPPTVTLSASPSSVTSGSTSTLSWTSTNTTSCSASGAWSGSEPTSGSQATAALSANSTFTLACSGNGGTSQASTSVTVSTAATTQTPSYTFRGIYDNSTYLYGITTEKTLGFKDVFAAPYASILDTVKNNGMQAFIWLGSYNIGGTCAFSKDDTWVKSVLTSTVVNHAANSHYYLISDDSGLDPNNGCTNMLSTIKSRVALVKSLDPKAIAVILDYRAGYLSRWKGIADMLWLDGYTNYATGYLETRIPNMASEADAAGIPYMGVIGAHQAETCTNPKILQPTPDILHHEFDQWRATNMQGYAVFAWRYPVPDCNPSVWLQNNLPLQDQLKIENGI